MTIRLPDDLMEWLEEQAKLNQRTKNKHIEHILRTVSKMPLNDKPRRHTLNSLKMCYNGHHHFIKADPAASDFCNCGVFVFGEVVR